MRLRTIREGDWFGVPLERGGYAVGLAARVGRRSGVVFGYFFGPKRGELPDPRQLVDLRFGDAVFAGRFYGDSLSDGEWPTIGRCEPWSRERWPMPPFFTGSAMPGTPLWRVVCSDNEPNRELETVEISQDEIEGLLPDVVHGEGVVEARLTELLDRPAAGMADADSEGEGRGAGESIFFLYFPSTDVARAAARELEVEGYEVRVEAPVGRAADLPFLVLASRQSHSASSDADSEEAEELMERLAGRYGGDYDGRERRVV